METLLKSYLVKSHSITLKQTNAMFKYLVVFLSVILFTSRIVSASLELSDSDSSDASQREAPEVYLVLYIYSLKCNVNKFILNLIDEYEFIEKISG
jgi:hypothetical protein